MDRLDSFDDVVDQVVNETSDGQSHDLLEILRRWPHLAEQIRSDLPGQLAERLGAAAEDTPLNIGAYRIKRRIGVGGMGSVYEVEHPTLTRPTAIKILSPGRRQCERYQKRFQREAETSTRLNHPNVVPVFDYGEADGNAYLVMAYIDGQALDSMLFGKGSAPAPFRPAQDSVEIAKLGADVAAGLAHAHELGIVHRDIKPANLLLDRAGRVWITDFGLAMLHGEFGELNQSGALVGTPRYMAPEQIGGVANEASDIYSLGLTLYELSVAERVWPSLKVAERVEQPELVVPDIRTRNPDLPEPLAKIIMRACALAPAERYSSAEELQHALRHFAYGDENDRRSTPRDDVSPRQASTPRASRTPRWSGSLLLTLCIPALLFAFAALKIHPKETALAVRTHLTKQPHATHDAQTLPVSRRQRTPATPSVGAEEGTPPATAELPNSDPQQPSLNSNAIEVIVEEGALREIADLATFEFPTLAGPDANLFRIVAGKLAFRSEPDAEDAQDADCNNVYEVVAIAAGRSAEYRVRVVNTNDAPRFRRSGMAFGPTRFGHVNVGVFPVADSEQSVGEGVLVSVTGGPDGHQVIASKVSDVQRFIFPRKIDTRRSFDANRDQVFDVVLTAIDNSFVHLAGVMETSALERGQALVFGKTVGKRANIEPVASEVAGQTDWLGIASSDGHLFYVAVPKGEGVGLSRMIVDPSTGIKTTPLSEDCGLPATLRGLATLDGQLFYAVVATEAGIDFVTYALQDDHTFREEGRLADCGLPSTIKALATCDGRLFMFAIDHQQGGGSIRWAARFDADRLVRQPYETKSETRWTCFAQWIKSDPNAKSVSQAFKIRFSDK